MKLNKITQKKLPDCVSKRSRKKRKKWKEHSELVPAIVNKSKSELKTKVVDKTENKDLPVTSIVSVVFRSSYTKHTTWTEDKEKDRSYKEMGRGMPRNPKAVLKNLLTVAQSGLDEKSSVIIQMKKMQASEYAL